MFLQESRRYNTDFVVEVLIDGSGSQRSRQSHVALQAFMISEALTNVGIPHRVMSFCTFWDYTVMRRFREYEDGREANLRIFEFYGSSNNRDGLALRAAGYLMEASKKAKRILLVLTDANPMDDQNIGEGAFYTNKEYTDQPAIEDTAREVQRLKQKGIQVIGIFMGSAKSREAAREIFDRELVQIQNINDFAGAVGRVLGEVMTP